MIYFRSIIPLLLVGFWLVAAPLPGSAAVLIFSESFETDGQGTRYTASQPFNQKRDNDAWDRGEIDDFNSLVPHLNPDSSFFWYAEDINAEYPGNNGSNGNDVQTIDFATIDISEFRNLEFIGLFASTANDFFGPGFPFHEVDDGIKVRFSIDGGAYQDGLCFARDSNSNMQLDFDCDGIGDGGLLTADFAGALNPYTFKIPNGNTLDLRIEVKADEASEELAFDRFQLFGDAVVVTGLPGPQAKAFLSAAAPNPFQDQTTIRYGLNVTGEVRLVVYDARGRLTRELVRGERPAGSHVVHWDGRDQSGSRVSTGTYFIRIQTKSFVQARKVQVLE